LFAGVAAASSLLTAAALPVLAIWIVAQNRAGRKWAKLAAISELRVIRGQAKSTKAIRP
jgi:hypothetical protein